MYLNHLQRISRVQKSIKSRLGDEYYPNHGPQSQKEKKKKKKKKRRFCTQALVVKYLNDYSLSFIFSFLVHHQKGQKLNQKYYLKFEGYV